MFITKYLPNYLTCLNKASLHLVVVENVFDVVEECLFPFTQIVLKRSEKKIAFKWGKAQLNIKMPYQKDAMKRQFKQLLIPIVYISLCFFQSDHRHHT